MISKKNITMNIFAISIALILIITVFLFTFGQIGTISKMKIKSFVFFVLPFLVIFSTTFKLNAQVHANFSFIANPASRCPPITVTFNNFSTGATTYSWTFGNGNTSTLPNPFASYSHDGTYSVKLIASNGGVSDDTTITITVFANPIPGFTTSTMPSCTNHTITFKNNSTGSAALTSWKWNFGDGTNQNTTIDSVTHSYGNAGVNIPVKMNVTDANGCVSSDTIIRITIASSPKASFTGSPTSFCSPPDTVHFTNTSTVAGTVSYLWNFGDGATSKFHR
jgi:PKD repeat protein